MTGVEGYVESTGSGLVAGVCAALYAKEGKKYSFPSETVLGAMARYVAEGSATSFQPMNANFGILPPLATKVKGGKRARNDAFVARSLEKIKEVREEVFG